MSYFRTFIEHAVAPTRMHKTIDLTGDNDSHTSNSAGHTGGARRRNAQQRLQRFVFTVPNWTDAELSWLKDTTSWPRIPKWVVIGKETCPTTGTPHLQGMFHFYYILY